MRLSKLSRSAPLLCDTFWLFDLSDLAPGQLLINISLSIVSLLPGKDDPFGYVLAQCILTENEMRLLLPLLDAPTGCQQAVLLASLYCTSDLFLQSLSDLQARSQWESFVSDQRDLLARAQEKRSQRLELRGVYNAIFTLRQKLEALGLTIRSSSDGYYLALNEEK